MEHILSVRKGALTYALIFRGGPAAPDGVRFLTERTDEFQVGVLERTKGHCVQPHTHPRAKRTIEGVSEFLYVERGTIRVTVFDEEWKPLEQAELMKGDFLLFLRGGHGIEVIDDCRMIEVKQGPYPGENAAKDFQPTV